jgi:hypothetical protein
MLFFGSILFFRYKIFIYTNKNVMVEKCKYCDKDISNLSSTKKGYHVANCDKNPNYKLNIEKRTNTISKNKRLKNPIIKLKLKCLNCDKDFEKDYLTDEVASKSYANVTKPIQQPYATYHH